MRLDLAINDIAAVAARLFAEHPELADDDILRADMFEGSTSADDVFETIAERIRECQANAEANANLAKLYRDRAAQFDHREEALRALAMRLLNIADLAKWQTAAGTFSLLAGRPKADVFDANMIPEALCRVKREPDRTAIKAALERGEAVPGARLTNGAPTVRFA